MNILPDLSTLSGSQLSQQNCALCGARLYRDRLLGRITYTERGREVVAELWGCAPRCAPSWYS